MSLEIVLVHPLFLEKDPVEKRIMTPYFPLGLMYLAAVVRQAGYGVELYDCTFRKDYREFAHFLQRKRPRIVGITSLITIRRHALILADLAHQYGAKVILGGPDPTGAPERYLFFQGTGNEFPVDAVVFDEGEHTFLELVGILLGHPGAEGVLPEIAGLKLRGDGKKVVTTKPRELIANLDTLPFPARDLVDMEEYRRAWKKAHGYFSLTLINTRGCPYHCTWCQKAVFGRRYHTRSPENSAEEMLLLKEQFSPDHLRLVDDITGVQKEWVLNWSRAVMERNAQIPFECLTRVNLVSEEMLKALKGCGCKKIYFGVESGSQKVLDAMEKGITVAQIYEASRLCRKVGIKTYFFMMVGYPGEEFEDLKLSVKLLRETRPDTFSTTIAYPLPGTKFYEQVRDRLLFDSGALMLDWEYTGENRLLFRRDRYGTHFYRWAMRWFNAEWLDARIAAGEVKLPLWRRLYFRFRLALIRMIVSFLARYSPESLVQFQPAEGR